MFLTEEQLAACQDDLRPITARRHSNGLYAFHVQSYYLQYEQLSQFVRRFSRLKLTPLQEQRWDDLRKQNGNQHNHIMVTVTPNADEENEKQLKNTCRQARKRYFNAAAVQTEYLSTCLQLPKEQAHYLEVAGKEVTVRSLNSWKKQTRATIKQFAGNQQFAAGFDNQQIGLSAPGTSSFEQDRLWKSAVKKVCPDSETDILRQHDTRILQGATAFVMATLDRDLHLDEDQIEILAKFVEATKPHEVSLHQVHVLEIAILARIDEDELNNVLHLPQQECWSLIRSSFRFHGKNPATITTQRCAPDVDSFP